MAPDQPSQAQLQPEHHTPIQDFHFWVSEKAVAGTRGPLTEVEHAFVPEALIYEFFEDDKRIRKILQALRVEPPGLAHQETIKLRYRKVFSILLHIGKGQFILNFVEYEHLDDRRLPFETEPNNFPKSADGLFDQFRKAQWMFHAAEFHHVRIDMRLGADSILPIIKKEKIKDANGVSADLHKVVLHSAHHHLQASREGNVSQEEASTFALKTYRSARARQFYETESNAFKRLFNRPNYREGIIGFNSSFIHGGTYNILLEYADRGTLENYFQNVSPPWFPDHIADFWNGFFGLAKALVLIHGELENDPDSLQAIRGWHQDIKPQNILVLSSSKDSDYACRFKLGDLGQSHFKAIAPGGARTSDTDSQGTRTYGAPECYRGADFTHIVPLSVRPSVDIWSLGCICSEAAVWLVRGQDGLQKYRKSREEALRKIPNFRDQDCFHDGSRVLECVTQTIEELRQNIRMDDYVTAGILDLIDDMLGPEISRPIAVMVLNRSQGYLKKRASTIMSRQASVIHGSPLLGHGPPTSREGTFPPISGFAPDARSSTFVQTYFSEQSREKSNQRTPSRTIPHPKISMSCQSLKDDTSPSQYSPVATPTQRGHCRDPSSTDFRALGLHIVPESANQFDPDNKLQESPKDISTDDLPQWSGGKNIGPSVPIRMGSRRTVSEPKGVTQTKKQTYMSVESATHWMRTQERNFLTRLNKYPLGRRKDLMELLNKRDHVFLIDDSESMQQHNDAVALLLELLVYIVKDSDPDGVDLFFAGSQTSARSKKVEKVSDTFDQVKFKGKPEMVSAMKKILGPFLEARHKGPPRGLFRKPQRPMTCYVLTDGNWDSWQAVKDTLIDFVGKLNESGIDERGFFGFQFISFGDNADNLAFLEHLDSELDLEPDIVDTEPSNGNVWKMLLGSIRDYWDGDPKKPPVPPSVGHARYDSMTGPNNPGRPAYLTQLQSSMV